MDKNNKGWYLEGLPTKIYEEFFKRWNDVHKLTFVEFHELVSKDTNRSWWIDFDNIRRTYDEYISGYLQVRYPSNLPVRPIDIWNEVNIDANKMINFK